MVRTIGCDVHSNSIEFQRPRARPGSPVRAAVPGIEARLTIWPRPGQSPAGVWVGRIVGCGGRAAGRPISRTQPSSPARRTVRRHATHAPIAEWCARRAIEQHARVTPSRARLTDPTFNSWEESVRRSAISHRVVAGYAWNRSAGVRAHRREERRRWARTPTLRRFPPPFPFF